MLFLGKNEPGLAIRFRDKNGGTMLSLAFVVAVELRKDRTMCTRGRGSTSSALAAVLCRSLCDTRDMYRSSRQLVLLLAISSCWNWKCRIL